MRLKSGILIWLGLLLVVQTARAQCVAPDCVAASTNPPGGLLPVNTPQMVLLSWDDSITTNSYRLVQSTLTNHVNPNGDAIKATFFISLDSKNDYVLVNHLYAAGHEIAVHTMTHTTSTNTGEDTWRREIVGCRKALATLGDISETNIVGFRAPYLQSNADSFRILEERGFLYESSLVEDLTGMSLSPSAMTWAYTLDSGAVENVPAIRKPDVPYPAGLFELHLYDLFDTNLLVVTSMDPPEVYTSNQVLALWKTNFLWHYEGNRAPLSIALHATTDSQWMSNPAESAWRIAAVNEFIDWALAYTNVYFVSYRDLAHFAQDPMDTTAAPTGAVFQTVTSIPASDTNRCTYPAGNLTVVGSCPAAYPNTSNILWNYVPATGGTVSFNINSQDVTYSYVSFTVTNTTSDSIYHWNVNFILPTGQISRLYDGSWTQTLEQVEVSARQYNTCLAPDASCTVAFRIDSTNISFLSTNLIIQGLGPQTPVLTTSSLQTGPTSQYYTLSWDETALEFELESTSNLTHTNWDSFASDITATNWTVEDSILSTQLYLRVIGDD